jgi:hypothetical protein
MKQQTDHVLKAENVKVAGTFHLDLNHAAAAPSNVAGTVSSGPQVCIVENNNTFAVVEFTCGCGAKTRVRCEYKDQT